MSFPASFTFPALVTITFPDDYSFPGTPEFPFVDVEDGWALIAGEDGTSFLLRAEDEGYIIKPRHYYTNSLGVIFVDGPATGVIQPAAPDYQWWKLNDGSGTAVAAAIGQAGTTNAEWIVNGAGFALRFNGTTHRASTTAALDLSSTNKITLLARVRINTLATTRLLFELSANAGAAVNTFSIYCSGGNLFGFLADATTPGNGNEKRSTTPPPTGEWVYLAVTCDHSVGLGGNGVKMWFNAVAQAMTQTSNGHAVPGNFAAGERFFMGARNDASLFYDGDFDDVRIERGELSVAEITEAMNNPQ